MPYLIVKYYSLKYDWSEMWRLQRDKRESRDPQGRSVRLTEEAQPRRGKRPHVTEISSIIHS